MDTHRVIASRYHINSQLGQGGMGTVYLARDTQTNTSVAIKQLRSDVAQPRLIERFKREGEALRNLNHPNIVKLLDTIEEAGEHYLIMEYVSGGDLADLLQRGKIALEQILRYALDLADALTRAHKLNIIHRDLKPANILIADDGTLRLTDFGIARLGSKDRVTDTDVIIGTVNYLPPEAFGEGGIDTRADIWAFGVILFEMLVGKHPFSGKSIIEAIHQITTAPIPNLESLIPDTPIELVDLVYRMLERDPPSRVASVRHVGAILEDIQEGRRTQSPDTKRFDTPPLGIELLNRHNLPVQTTPFVGREAEVDALVKLLDDPANRLITILAPGGMGKTRLSLEVAERCLERYADGVFFIELAPLSDTDNIMTTIADALGYHFQADGRDLLQQIQDYLSQKTLLLVLDNFEHLLDAAGLVTDILHASPQVNILATSRERLDQIGETLYHLSGMGFSAWETLADAIQFGSVQLFLQSAKRVRSDFELTKGNLDDVTRICKLVQGMPLGILLSASWLGMLSPSEVADEIAGSIDFLEASGNELPERQRSIRVVFEYSWESMTSAEQEVFMRLSVFRGGFTREAATVVSGANLRVLMGLTNKSLIRRDPDSGRYDIHELLRQYAEDQLNQHNLAETCQRTYIDFYVKLAEKAEAELRYADQEHWFSILNEEHGNLREALKWSLEYNIEDTLKIMASSRDFWFYQGHHTEAYTWMSKIREQENKLDTLHKARLFSSMSIIAWALQKTDEAEYFALQGFDLLDSSSNKYYLGWALVMLVSIMGIKDGKYQAAMQFGEQAKQLFLDINDRAGLAQLYNSLGNAHEYAGNYTLAMREFENSIEMSRQTGETRRIAMNQGNLARLKIQDGDYKSGLALMKQTIKLDYQIRFQYMLIFDLNGFAQLLVEIDRPYEALILLSANAAFSELLGIKIQPADYAMWQQTSEAVRHKLDNDQYQQAWQRGQKMTFEQAMEYSLNIELDE